MTAHNRRTCDEPNCRSCWKAPVQVGLLDVGQSAKPPSLIQPKNPESESNEFYSPSPLVKAIEELLGVRFTVDASATAESAKCVRYYSMADDAFRQDFTDEDVWNNPPYDVLGPWLALAVRWLTGLRRARTWTHLIPANRSDQPYWFENVGRYVDLPADRERVQVPALMPNGKVLQLAKVVPCAPRMFVVERVEISGIDVGGRIPFGFPGDPEGRTSRGGSFPSLVLHWKRAGEHEARRVA